MKQAVCVTFVVKPEFQDDFIHMIQENAATSLEREEACLQFDVCMDGDNPFEIFLYEIYDSPAAFADHLKTDHFRLFDKDTSGMIASKHVKMYQTVI